MSTSRYPVTVARTTPESHRFPVHCGGGTVPPRPHPAKADLDGWPSIRAVGGSSDQEEGQVAEALRLTAVAFQFLTRIPVPQIRVGDGDLRRASAAFPLVGLVVGAAAERSWAGRRPS
jgi:hypothetical protein